MGERIDGPIDEITPTYLTPDVILQLRTVDNIVNKILRARGLHLSISQVPVVSFPVNFGNPGYRSIGIRTMMTENYKSGDIALPGRDFPEDVLDEIAESVLKVNDIARIVYDLTSKPPATTEWE
jgi:GMP synthase (glutamine-hydrolysing)